MGSGTRVRSRKQWSVRVRSAVVAVAAAAALVAVPAAGPADAQGPRCGGLPATIVGTDGDDVLTGTAGRDVIAARGGDDVINGAGGNDIICGNGGNDRINGGGGNDRIVGNGGDDRISGGSGNDNINGSGGADRIKGGGGSDRLKGGGGADVLKGGGGADTLAGGGGVDRLSGGKGNDSCSGGKRAPDRTPDVFFGEDRSVAGCELAAVGIFAQTVTHNGHGWRVIGAASSFESPFTYGNSSRTPQITDQRYLYVTVEVFNGLSSTIFIPNQQILLSTPGRPLVTAERGSVSATPGTTDTELFSFPIPSSADINEAVLVLGTTDVEQTLLPISDQAPSTGFPMAGSVDGTRRTVELRICNNETDVQLSNARWTLELGDRRPDGGNTSREWSYRAAAGTRFLLVDARFFGLSDSCGGTNVQSADMRIDIDGVPRSVWTFHNDIVRAGEALDHTLGFVVPADATSVTILIGRFGELVAEFPVEVPDLSG